MITNVSRSVLLGLAGATVLLLSACGGAEGAADDQATGDAANGAGSTGGDDAAGGGDGAAAEGQGSATLTMDGRSFSFTLGSCLLSDGDALISGPGADDESGEPAYLDVDYYDSSEVSGGEARIDLGTDRKFSSSDEFYRMGGGSGDGSIEVDGRQLTLTADVLDGGETSLGSGTLHASC